MFGIGKKKEGAEAAASVAPSESEVALQPAGFWLRVVAFIVDYALLLIVGGAMMMGAAGVGGTELAEPVYWLWVLITFLYWPVLESTSLRATIGKAMVGLVVADVDGGGLSFVRSLLRNLAKIISAIPFFIGFLLAAFTTRKQALHDLITKAVVLRKGASSFARAIGVLVVGFALLIMGGYVAYDTTLGTAMKDFEAMMSGETPMPAKPVARPAPAPVAKPTAPTPPPAPVAAAPVAATTPAPAPTVQPPAPPEPVAKPAAAPAPAAKPAPATPAPAQAATPAAAPAPTAKPAPATPAPAPAATPAAAPAPAAKPAAAPAVKPEPAKTAAAPKPPATEERKPEPPPAPSTRPRLEPVTAPLPQPSALSPKFNDVMTAVLYRDPAAVTQLLDLGRWADKRDSNRLTPLMVAAMNGDAGMVSLLLARGADPDLLAPGGLTALDFALQNGDGATSQLLQSRGAR